MKTALIRETKRACARVLSALPVSSRHLGPPKGTRESALTAVREHGGSLGEVIAERPPIDYVQPPTKTVEDEALYFQGRRVHLHPYAATFPGGRIYGKEGIVILPDDRVPLDLIPPYYVQKKHREGGGLRVLRKLKMPPLRKVDGHVVSLALGDTQNYSHWTFQNMTRLQLLRSAAIDADYYYVDASQRFQRDYLEIMGVPMQKVIPVEPRAHIQASELIVVGGCSYNQVPHPDLLREVRDNVLGPPPASPRRRLYVSRADASYRRVCNEEDVMSFLSPLGFERVTMAGRSVREQAQLLSCAEVVIGPHGANMTNLVFCQRGIHVLEMFQPDWLDSGFTAPSAQVGLQYFYALGEKCQHHGNRFRHPGVAPCFRFRLDRVKRFMEIVEGAR